MTGTLTLQLVMMVEVRKEETSESLVMIFVMDKRYFLLLFSFSCYGREL